jgi:hypothetical protein
MLRHLRSALIPVLSLVIGLGGISFGLAGGTLPASPASSESELPEETTVGEEPVSEEPTSEEPTSEEPEVVEPTPAPEDPLVADPVAEEGDGAATDTAVQEWSTEGCPEGFTGNHGQYVSSTEDRPRNEAAHSECGKPVHGDDEGSEDGDDDSSSVDENAQTGNSKKGNKGAH